MFKTTTISILTLVCTLGLTTSLQARILPDMAYSKEERMQQRHTDDSDDLAITEGIPLEQQQASTIDDLYTEYKQHMANHAQQLKAIDKALYNEIIAEQPDEHLIQQHAEEKAHLTQQMTVIKTQIMHQIYQTLEPEQQQRMRHNLSKNLSLDFIEEKKPFYKNLLNLD